MEDLEQVAALGLVKALAGFDPNRGVSFVSYAVPTITGELRRHYRDKGWAVHVPRGAQELSQRVTAGERELERGFGRRPTTEELAEHLGLEVEQILEGKLTGTAMRADSLDAPHGSGDSTLSATLPGGCDPGFDQVDTRSMVSSLTSQLGERDRTIITMRFGQHLSQAEIGRRVGLSQMHISRILRRTAGTMRASAQSPTAAEESPDDIDLAARG